MVRDPRYDCLFEPIRIGPLTARNRFYQVPHCNGMGRLYPSSMIEMRRHKAEGGWAVVCTEQCDIHPSSEVAPHGLVRLWDDRDLPIMAGVADAVHEHGALAGIELTHNGAGPANHFSREVPIAPSLDFGYGYNPVQARAMSKTEIAQFRRWHKDAVRRAKKAGFDVIYIYAGHDTTLQSHFLSRRHNHRTDEYGGSLENRIRLLRETLEDAKDVAGDTCAIAIRFTVETNQGPDGMTPDGDGRAAIELLADLPDLWDVNISDWSYDSITSRFGPEGSHEPFIAFVKQVTKKPVVGVGRYTSPDTMVSALRRGIMDMIGAARPSIADPFLPNKIAEGRIDDIRECIGCNICVSGEVIGAPMRCTQNPTMGEEWRRGWHPEIITRRASDESFLVVGAGAAGLECARALGQRGYKVTLAEAANELGGRVGRECRLPGLAAWGRVRDWRVGQIAKMTNVEVFRASRLGAADVLGFGADRVVIATGSRWRQDGVGRANRKPIPGHEGRHVVTADAVIDGAMPADPIVIFDDDHYYMGGVLAEKLRLAGRAVTLVTPAALVSIWTEATLEQWRIQKRLLELGVEIVTGHNLVGIGEDSVDLACEFTERRRSLPAGSVVMVTSREPDDALYHELLADPTTLADAGIKDVSRIGDCYSPGTVAAAVHSGHRFARDLSLALTDEVPFAVESIVPQILAPKPARARRAR